MRARTSMRARGLSLIELIVVIAILAVLAAAALLSADLAGSGRHAQRESERLGVMLELACERAELSGGEYGVHFGQKRYAFSRYTVEGWIMERDGALVAHDLPGGFGFDVTRDGDAVELVEALSAEPVAACYPSGELAPFRATLTLAQAPLYTISGDADGRVLVEPVTTP
jgi:type II secretion system protein H